MLVNADVGTPLGPQTGGSSVMNRKQFPLNCFFAPYICY